MGIENWTIITSVHAYLGVPPSLLTLRVPTWSSQDRGGGEEGVVEQRGGSAKRNGARKAKGGEISKGTQQEGSWQGK